MLCGCAVLLCAARYADAAMTITYGYDAQDRLTQVSYSDHEKEAFVYDSASNVLLAMAITDANYLESFLLYFTLVDPISSPAFRQIITACRNPIVTKKPDWNTIWAKAQSKA